MRMKEVSINKVVINIGVGAPGDELRRAKELLQRTTGEQPIKTKATEKIPEFGVNPGAEVGCKVTLRGKKAKEILHKLIQTLDKIERRQVNNGTFSFGIEEYIEIPNIEYNTEIGMFGMDVCVNLEKPGNQEVRKEEAIGFLEEEFDIEVK